MGGGRGDSGKPKTIQNDSVKGVMTIQNLGEGVVKKENIELGSFFFFLKGGSSDVPGYSESGKGWRKVCQGPLHFFEWKKA